MTIATELNLLQVESFGTAQINPCVPKKRGRKSEAEKREYWRTMRLFELSAKDPVWRVEAKDDDSDG